MEISETTVKLMLAFTSALVTLVVVDARWLGPWRIKRRRMKLEQNKS